MTANLTTPSGLVDAFADTLTGTKSVCRSLTPDEWDAPTGCPGWTVKDNVAHITAIESWTLGRPDPDHEPPDLPHVKSDVGRYMEIGVDFRRSRPPAEVMAEFEEVTSERLAALLAMDDDAFDVVGPGPLGPMKLRDLVALRTFDCWAHEQDIRRATGRRGGLDGPAARLLVPRIAGGLARVAAKVVSLPPGTQVGVRVAAPLDAQFTLVVDDDGRGVVTDGVAPDATAMLETDSDNFVALVFGRSDARPDDVNITGDTAITKRLLEQMSLTP